MQDDRDVAGLRGPSPRDYVHGLSAVGILLAVMIGVPIWLLVAAGPSCGCSTPVTVIVYDTSPNEATFRWESSGLLGTPIFGGSGTVPLAACSNNSEYLPAGRHQITVTTPTASRSFDLSVPWEQRSDTLLWIVIRADGAIDQVAAGSYPADPPCGPS